MLDRVTLFAITSFALAVVLPCGPALADHESEAGEKVFKTQCSACHTVEQGKNRIGPSLFGVVGRHSGTVQGFKYSAANKNSDLTWTPEELDKYLTNPRAVVPGTIMTYAGLKNDTQRHDLIEYLKSIH